MPPTVQALTELSLVFESSRWRNCVKCPIAVSASIATGRLVRLSNASKYAAGIVVSLSLSSMMFLMIFMVAFSVDARSKREEGAGPQPSERPCATAAPVRRAQQTWWNKEGGGQRHRKDGQRRCPAARVEGGLLDAKEGDRVQAPAMSGADVAMKYAAYPDRLRGAPWWRRIGHALVVIHASNEGEALIV